MAVMRRATRPATPPGDASTTTTGSASESGGGTNVEASGELHPHASVSTTPWAMRCDMP